MTGLRSHMWLSFSPDLRHWGDSRVLLPARRGGWWDANKVGLGPPPLLTKNGWLVCYHGVRVTASGSIYRLGLALLDRDDPTKVLARGNEWVFGPHEGYERRGDVPDVVFPGGWILRDDGDAAPLLRRGRHGGVPRRSKPGNPARPPRAAPVPTGLIHYMAKRVG